jgi:hypothetical protein
LGEIAFAALALLPRCELLAHFGGGVLRDRPEVAADGFPPRAQTTGLTRQDKKDDLKRIVRVMFRKESPALSADHAGVPPDNELERRLIA